MFFDITKEDLLSQWGNRKVYDARHMIFSILRKKTNLSLMEIGNTLNRSHGAALSGISKVKK